MADSIVHSDHPILPECSPNSAILSSELGNCLSMQTFDPIFSSQQDGDSGFDSDLPIPLPLDEDFDLDMIFDGFNVDEFLNSDESHEFIDGQASDNGTNSIPESGVSRGQGSERDGAVSGSGSCDSGAIGDTASPAVSESSENVGTLVDSNESGKVKVEDDSSQDSTSKRKTEEFENGNEEVRGKKYMKSGNEKVNTSADCLNFQFSGGASEVEEKKKARLMRNRESAQLSRQRKKHYVEELEEKVRAMHSTISDLNGKVSFFMAENASLRQQLSGNTVCPAPLYPPPMTAPIPYPWMPYPPYVVKPQGSQVPLVPIPKLKPQKQAAPVSKKVEGEKTKGKSKKIASLAVLSMLSICLFFGGFAPQSNNNDMKSDDFSGVRNVGNRLHEDHRGRILVADWRSSGILNNSSRRPCTSTVGRKPSTSHETRSHSNGTEPLFASLYVPRNDKLEKIDGNLIIHSVLATDKAMAFRDSSDVNKSKETGMIIRRDFSPPLALPDGSQRSHLQSSEADSKMHQWFREGLAEPMLSSGMCSEVFQFDVSSAIVASPARNITAKMNSNATSSRSGNNRRALHNLPLRNSSIGGDNKRDAKNKGVSSTVVSVLVDPRETGEIEVDGMIRSKALSRIFVVVLHDSVKYVTYSCRLPQVSHLVTT